MAYCVLLKNSRTLVMEDTGDELRIKRQIVN